METITIVRGAFAGRWGAMIAARPRRRLGGGPLRGVAAVSIARSPDELRRVPA